MSTSAKHQRGDAALAVALRARAQAHQAQAVEGGLAGLTDAEHGAGVARLRAGGQAQRQLGDEVDTVGRFVQRAALRIRLGPLSRSATTSATTLHRPRPRAPRVSLRSAPAALQHAMLEQRLHRQLEAPSSSAWRAPRRASRTVDRVARRSACCARETPTRPAPRAGSARRHASQRAASIAPPAQKRTVALGRRAVSQGSPPLPSPRRRRSIADAVAARTLARAAYQQRGGDHARQIVIGDAFATLFAHRRGCGLRIAAVDARCWGLAIRQHSNQTVAAHAARRRRCNARFWIVLTARPKAAGDGVVESQRGSVQCVSSKP